MFLLVLKYKVSIEQVDRVAPARKSNKTSWLDY